jgi:hypothetical protein
LDAKLIKGLGRFLTLLEILNEQTPPPPNNLKAVEFNGFFHWHIQKPIIKAPDL